MKKKALRKEFFMEIKKTRNRFISILVIVALGVAFFSGIRATHPDMVLSADTFYDDTNLMDIRVAGTLGMTDRDVEAISRVEGVKDVMPVYQADMLGNTAEHQLTLQVQSLPDTVNKVTITEGRLPKAAGECFVDSQLVENGFLSIGETIVLKSGSDQSTDEILHETEYVIVGAGTSPLYLSLERGTTTIGTGNLDGFLMVPEESFAMDYYAQICVTAEGAKDLSSYTDEYDDFVDVLVARIEELEEVQSVLRYEEVQKEGADQIAEGEAELEDAGAELADGQQKLSDAEKELSDARKKLADGEAELLEKEQELNDARKELDDGWKELTAAKEEMALSTLEIEIAHEEYNRSVEQLARWKDQKVQIEQLLAAQGLSDEQLEAMGIPRLSEAQIQAYEQDLAQLAAGISQMEAALPEAKATLDAYDEQLKIGGNQLIYAERQLEEAQAQWADGYAKIQDAKLELEDGKAELADAEEKLLEAKEELADGQKKYDEALAENEPKIADAKQELADLEQPQWYVLDRQYLQTYVEYGQDAERIGAIGEWFPAIFFLVAALVCLTTMTRMVEEERTQIGTLKALGYSSMAIASKYIFYALLSSLLGSLLGIVVGQTLLPLVIINAYKMLYVTVPKALTPLNFEYSVTSSVTAVLCTTVAAVSACYKELLSVPASLMRPQAPKAGKRVFLEHMTFIWKRLDFSHKATVRNLVRYKKRFFMTVFGIGGCMALLLLGFGLRDSIGHIGTAQYGEIRTYEAAFYVEEDAKEAEKEALCEAVEADERIISSMRMHEGALDVEANGVIKSGYILVPENAEGLSEYIQLHDRLTREEIGLETEGVVLSEKLAKLLDVQVGDTVLLKEEETSQAEAVVTGIAENYLMHYVYLSPEAYEAIYGEAFEYNAIYARTTSAEAAFEEDLRMEYLEYEAVSDVTFSSSMRNYVLDMVGSLDTVIWVLVISAGLLAFVVLYNLNNINVSERKRELATLKVLGFYDGEVTGYVNRENVVLTLVGALVGVFLGILLHRFLIITMEIDMLMFGRDIKPMSFVYSILLTFLFSMIVNGVMHFKLKKIDMVESMKSVE